VPERVYLAPGQRVKAKMPWSEVCWHMRVADKEMLVELTAKKPPMVQLFKLDGGRFSFPILPGEAGIFRDHIGYYITVEAAQPAVTA
jgi:hypothetical protein